MLLSFRHARRRDALAHHEPTRAVAIDTCRRLLSRNLRHPLTMTEAARHRHVTERTLRRQLTDAGERYSTIRDRVRERRATFLLQESKLTIDAIAHETGFSDARELRRAYLRWTGTPPSVPRRR